MGRYGGALAGVRPDNLAAHVLAQAVERTGIDPAAVCDVYLGAANQAGEDNRDAAGWRRSWPACRRRSRGSP